MNDELGGKIMKEFAPQIPKTYSYSTNDSNKNKKREGIKKCVIKRKFKFEDYKYFFEATQLENKKL